MAATQDLDQRIAALTRAVRAGQREAVGELLAGLERELERLNPLARATTYAHVKAAMGKPREAAAVLEDLLELIEDGGAIHYQLGCYRREGGELEGAQQAFARAVQLDASRTDAWVSLGVLLDERGDPRGAIEAYRSAILRSPTDADVWRNLGNSLAAQADYEQAIDAYEVARQQRPEDPTVVFLIASAHQARGALALANAALTPGLREELGEVLEARIEASGLELRCRFHATAERREEHLAAAEALLREVAPELAARTPDLPWRRGDVFVVRAGSSLLVCDADAVRRDHPHRFLDATRSVELAARERTR